MDRPTYLLTLLIALFLMPTVISAHHQSSATPIEVGESYEFSLEEVSRLKIQLELGQMVFLRVEDKVDLQGLFSDLYYVFPEKFSMLTESDDHLYYRLGAGGAENDTYLIDVVIPPNCCEDPMFTLDVIASEAIMTEVGDTLTILADTSSPYIVLFDASDTPYIQALADIDGTSLRLESADGVGLNRHGDDLSGHLSLLNEHDAYVQSVSEAPIRLMVFAPQGTDTFVEETQVTIQIGDVVERSIDIGETLEFTAEDEYTQFTVAVEPYQPLLISFQTENPAWLTVGEQRTGHNNSGSPSDSLEVVPTNQSGEVRFTVSDVLRYGATGDFTVTVEAIELLILNEQPTTVEVGYAVIAADLVRDQRYRLTIKTPSNAEEFTVTAFGLSYPRFPSIDIISDAEELTQEFIATRDGRAFMDITYNSDEIIAITITLELLEDKNSRRLSPAFHAGVNCIFPPFTPQD